ncbi:MAG: ACT domain-containing protein [Anaeromyxobacter sp.]|nr:ACT domain-containing protein [Anaeromyxobacter sp.]MBL0276231.1 ACT domain-containing protein [Anaeromyxobacter sp.]
MPRVKQLSAWVEDRPGVLGLVAAALGDRDVSIRAFMASSLDGKGFVRLVVDKPAAAQKVLKALGWSVTVDEVVEVTTADKPGALGQVADKLGARGINIQYAYVGQAGAPRKVNFYLAVEDVKKALAALR